MPKGSASRAEALINKVNKELAPLNLPDFSTVTTRGKSMIAALDTSVVMLRRGIRSLQGKENSQQLRAKRARMQDIMQEAKDLREMTFNLGKLSPEELKNVDEFSVMTGQSKAEYLKEKAKERMRKYGKK